MMSVEHAFGRDVGSGTRPTMMGLKSALSPSKALLRMDTGKISCELSLSVPRSQTKSFAS